MHASRKTPGIEHNLSYTYICFQCRLRTASRKEIRDHCKEKHNFHGGKNTTRKFRNKLKEMYERE